MSLIMLSTVILMFFGLSAATCIQDSNGVNTLCTSADIMQTPPDETSLLQVGSHYSQGELRGASAGHAAPSPGGFSKPVMAKGDSPMQSDMGEPSPHGFSKPVMATGDSPIQSMEMEERELEESKELVAKAEELMDKLEQENRKAEVKLDRKAVQVKAASGDAGDEVLDSEVVEANSLLLPIEEDEEFLKENWISNSRPKSWTLVVDRGNTNQEYLGLDSSKGTFYETTTSGVSLKLREAQPTAKTHAAGAEVLLLEAPWGELIKGFRHTGPDKMFCLMLGSWARDPFKFKGSKVITWMDHKGTPFETQVEHIGRDKAGNYLLFLEDNMIGSDGFYNDYSQSSVSPIVVTTDHEAIAAHLKPR